MDRIISLLELATANLITGKVEEYIRDATEVVNLIVRELPQIISYYTDPKMQDIAGDALYWPAQCEKMLKSFEAGDEYYIADVLYNETRTKFIDLKKELIARGIIE